MSFLRTLLGGTLFLLALAISFWLVYSNSTEISIKLVGVWNQGIPNPFHLVGGGDYLIAPLGIWYLVFTVIGIFIGLFSGWFIGGETRVRARQQRRRAHQVEKKLSTIKKEAEGAKIQIDNLKSDKKNLENKIKASEETPALSPPDRIKQITDS